MARIRSIKPEFWESETITALPIQTRLFFIGLWNFCDDKGRFRARPRVLRRDIYPFDDFTTEDVLKMLCALTERSLIAHYTHSGEFYGQITNWDEHQHPNRPQPPQWPGPDDDGSEPTDPRERLNHAETDFIGAEPDTDPNPTISESSVNGHGAFTERSLTEGRVGEGRGENRTSSLRSDVVEHARPISETVEIWSTYQRHHPAAVLTGKRRKLIAARLKEGFTLERLIAAIDGNHRDPHCNGENDRGREYHAIELILRDAAHVERYEAVPFERVAAPAAKRYGRGSTVREAFDDAQREARREAERSESGVVAAVGVLPSAGLGAGEPRVVGS